MARHSEDLYGSEGSVPNDVPVNGSGASPMNVRATPEDFGAQVGQSIQKTGEAAEGLATQYGNMVNETLLTNADSALARKVGEIKGAYLQNTGLAAAAAFPKYQADLEAARLQARASLPLGAAHGFDMLATRTIANHEADGSTYAAGQTRQALIDSGTNLQNANVQAVLDPDIAKDPDRVQWHQDSAIHGLQMTMDENHPGLKMDPENGTFNFDESKPEGRDLKAQYQAGVDNIITQTQTNRFNTLAKGDVLGAFGIYKQERDSLPRPAQVQLDSMFEPMVFNAHVKNGSNQVIAEANQHHADLLYNPSSAGSNANNLGNVKTGDGARNNTADFVAPATPVDGAILTANNLRSKNYEGKTLEQIGHTWTSTDPDNWVKNVSLASGIDPKSTPDLNDPATLGKLLKGIAVAEKSPSDRARFTDDVISQGVSAALGGAQPQTALNEQKKSYATNVDGSKLTTADYYRAHSEDVLARADVQSERDMPGDLVYKRAMRETVTNYMNKVISNQSAQYTLDNRNVVRGINGELTKGKPPETEAELRAIPGMDDLLNKVAAQDPKFAEGIPTMIAKVARRNDVTNSANSYETITRVLQPQDDDQYPNHIKNQTQLDVLLGKSDGTGINMKDYNDAKPATELPSEMKDALLKHMEEITNANGNIDGKGQQRAVAWYNQAMNAWKKNSSLAEKALPAADFIARIGEKEGPPAPTPPSRIQQIINWASSIGKKSEIPTLTDKSQFDSLKSGDLYIRNGQQYRKP